MVSGDERVLLLQTGSGGGGGGAKGARGSEELTGS